MYIHKHLVPYQLIDNTHARVLSNVRAQRVTLLELLPLLNVEMPRVNVEMPRVNVEMPRVNVEM